MMRTSIIIGLIFTMTICLSQETSHINEFEIHIDTSSLNPISCAFNISAWQFDTIHNTIKRTLTRTVNTGSLKNDSLCYWLDKHDWYTPIPAEEGDIEYYIEMSINGIDKNKLKASYNGDNFNIHIYMTNNNNIMISKITWDKTEMKRLWTIESDSISIDFPNDLDRIRHNFTEYNMFNPETGCTVDYLQNRELTLTDKEIAEKVIEILKE